MKYFLIYVIRVYRRIISPLFVSVFGNACRFTPTCSQYTIEALEKHGFARGLLLGIARFVRCHPWSKTGYDPVPNK